MFSDPGIPKISIIIFFMIKFDIKSTIVIQNKCKTIEKNLE